MSQVTAKQVKTACLAAKIVRVPHHDCGLCGSWTCYRVQDGNLFFDSSCDCCPPSEPQPRAWDDAADWINMQTDDVHRNRLMQAFGFPVDGPSEAKEK